MSDYLRAFSGGRGLEHSLAIDSTVNFHEGHWHVSMTVKLPDRSAIDRDKAGKGYGKVSWRIGLPTPVPE